MNKEINQIRDLVFEAFFHDDKILEKKLTGKYSKEELRTACDLHLEQIKLDLDNVQLYDTYKLYRQNSLIFK